MKMNELTLKKDNISSCTQPYQKICFKKETITYVLMGYDLYSSMQSISPRSKTIGTLMSFSITIYRLNKNLIN